MVTTYVGTEMDKQNRICKGRIAFQILINNIWRSPKVTRLIPAHCKFFIQTSKVSFTYMLAKLGGLPPVRTSRLQVFVNR